MNINHKHYNYINPNTTQTGNNISIDYPRPFSPVTTQIETLPSEREQISFNPFGPAPIPAPVANQPYFYPLGNSKISCEDSNPKAVICPFCNQNTTTVVEKRVRILYFLLCFLFTGPIITMILYFSGCLSCSQHTCHRCNAVLSTPINSNFCCKKKQTQAPHQ